MADLRKTEIALAGAADTAAIESFYSEVGYGGGVSPSDRILIVRHSGEIIAAVKLSTEHGVLVLRGMYVGEPLRGTGVGSKLLERIAEEIGLAACWCIPYSHLERFYSQIGFRAVENGQAPEFLAARKRRYLAADHQVIIMWRPADATASS